MATASPKLPPLPGSDVPVVSRDGLVDPTWYQWLKVLEAVVTQLRKEIP